MEHQTNTHRAVVQRNPPEPPISNRTDRDGTLGGKRHSARALPIAPNGNILERIVIVSVLQVLHGHDARASRGVHQDIKGYLAGVLCAAYLSPYQAAGPIAI